jgi:hypothetical protein
MVHVAHSSILTVTCKVLTTLPIETLFTTMGDGKTERNTGVRSAIRRAIGKEKDGAGSVLTLDRCRASLQVNLVILLRRRALKSAQRRWPPAPPGNGQSLVLLLQSSVMDSILNLSSKFVTNFKKG